MILGIPQGLMYFRYKTFIEAFSDRLPVKPIYSGQTTQAILDKGIAHCVDEACLPIKVFHGHTAELQGKCDAIMIPRFLKCEYGQTFCPKLVGLPDLIQSSFPHLKKKELSFTSPFDLSKMKALDRRMRMECGKLGISAAETKAAVAAGIDHYSGKKRGLNEEQYRHKVFLAGHSYNLYDSFVNKNLINKLHKMDIGVVTEESIPYREKDTYTKDLIKKPLWLFYQSNFGGVKYLAERKLIDGVLYLSSFSCGLDSIIIDMVKNGAGGLPVLVLKLDEQTGEAGMDTRLEAFQEVLRQ